MSSYATVSVHLNFDYRRFELNLKEVVSRDYTVGKYLTPSSFKVREDHLKVVQNLKDLFSEGSKGNVHSGNVHVITNGTVSPVGDTGAMSRTSEYANEWSEDPWGDIINEALNGFHADNSMEIYY